MRGQRRKHWADPKMYSPYSDGQYVHPYQEGAAHTHHAPHMLPPSVGYLHSVKISAYHTNVPYNNQTPVVHKPVKRGRRGEGMRG